jgi:hypothetical protein
MSYKPTTNDFIYYTYILNFTDKDNWFRNIRFYNKWLNYQKK